MFGIFSLFQILKAVNKIPKVSWEERFSVWLTSGLTYCQIESRANIEGILCKSYYQIYKPIEIRSFILWYHEDNNSANVYYDLAYPNKITIKRIKSLKVKQVHFSFAKSRKNTEHGVLEKASWGHPGDSLDLILIDPSNSGRISAS